MSEPFEAQDKLKLRPPREKAKAKSRSLLGRDDIEGRESTDPTLAHDARVGHPRRGRRKTHTERRRVGQSARGWEEKERILFFDVYPALTHFVALRVGPEGLTYDCGAPPALGKGDPRKSEGASRQTHPCTRRKDGAPALKTWYMIRAVHWGLRTSCDMDRCEPMAFQEPCRMTNVSVKTTESARG